jgi:hypothetical protein
MPPLKRLLLVSVLAVLAATAGYWAAKGAHTGWSQNRVPVSKTDEVTGIVFTAYEDRFVPGIEVLGAGGLAATCLLVAAIFVRSKKPSSHNS